MSYYMNMVRALERRSLGRTGKPADDAAKAGAGTKGVAARSSDDDETPSAVLTLDDFGGRSDALGG
jgi:hypothetical protein